MEWSTSISERGSACIPYTPPFRGVLDGTPFDVLRTIILAALVDGFAPSPLGRISEFSIYIAPLLSMERATAPFFESFITRK